MSPRIYLDFNATTPLHNELKAFVIQGLDRFGNPSSIHADGRLAKSLISSSRLALASLLKCDPFEILFTGSGSEANNLALKGVLSQGIVRGRDEIICLSVEHPSVLKTMQFLSETYGFKLIQIRVNRDGAVDMQQYEAALSDKTRLVSLQLVNNETGHIFPLKKMARLAKKVGALVHSDMVQALGKLPLDVPSFEVDMATFAGHKFYSMKGAGFLYVRPQVHLTPLVHGGGQERGRRAGTENALAIGCLGEAARILGPRIQDQIPRLEGMRDAMELMIEKEIPGAVINGRAGKRVCNTSSISFSGIDGESLLMNLDMQGVSVSTGAACSSGAQEASPVLRAMGLSLVEASQSMRISLGWPTTHEDVSLFVSKLKTAVRVIREANDTQEVGIS